MKYKNTIGATLMLGLTIYCIVTPSVGYFAHLFVVEFLVGLFQMQ